MNNFEDEINNEIEKISEPNWTDNFSKFRSEEHTSELQSH